MKKGTKLTKIPAPSKGSKTTTSTNDKKALYDIVSGIIKVVEESGKATTVKFGDRSVTITPETVFMGADEVLRVLKSH